MNIHDCRWYLQNMLNPKKNGWNEVYDLWKEVRIRVSRITWELEHWSAFAMPSFECWICTKNHHNQSLEITHFRKLSKTLWTSKVLSCHLFSDLKIHSYYSHLIIKKIINYFLDAYHMSFSWRFLHLLYYGINK